MIFMWWSLLAYGMLVYVGLRLIVPNFGFRKSTLPAEIPEKWRHVIEGLDARSTDDLEFARHAHAYLAERFTGSRIRTVTNFWRAFMDPFSIQSGFLPCTAQNHLLRVMLVASGRFTDGDIILRTVPLNLFIHQYVRLRVRGEWKDIDPWASFLGIPFGKKLAFFG